MFKFSRFLFCLGVLFFAFNTFAFADESITITTYYPSPYGSYNQLYVADKLNIGTTTPYARLNVETDGSAASPGAYPSAPLGYFLSWAGDGPTTDTGVPLFAIAAGRIWTTDTYAANARLFQVSTDNGVQFIIRGTGNVGIGTANPSGKLEVVGDIVAHSNVASNCEWVAVYTGSAYICPAGKFVTGVRDINPSDGSIDGIYCCEL